MEKIEISTGASRFETHWTTEIWTWAQLCDRLAQFESGSETHAEYMALAKPEQAKLKDIGGFVGGPLVDGRRKRGHCQNRQLITLDMDNLDAGTTETLAGRHQRSGLLLCRLQHPQARPGGPATSRGAAG